MLSENDLGALLTREVESSERPSAIIDVRKAMSVGKRHQRLRRGSVLAVTLVVAAVATGSVVLTTLPDGAGPDTAGGVPTIGSSRIETAPEMLDPMIRYLRFGWLPDGLPDRFYGTGTRFDTASSGSAMLRAGAEPDPNAKGVTVSLYAKGVVPPAPQSDVGPVTGSVAPAPDVQGKPALWVSYAVPMMGNQGGIESRDHLRWQYAPGGWVEVEARGLGDNRAIARRVADAVFIGVTEAVSLPFELTGLPAGIRPHSVSVSENLNAKASFGASAHFTSAPLGADSSPVYSNLMSVVVNPYQGEDRTGGKGYDPANTTVDGHRAAAKGQDGDNHCGVAVYDVDAVNVSVDAAGEQVLDRLGPGGCLGVYHQIQLKANLGGWTTGLGVTGIPGK